MISFLKKHHIYKSKTSKKLLTYAELTNTIIIYFQNEIKEIKKGELTKFQKENNYPHIYNSDISSNQYKTQEDLIKLIKKKHNKYKEDAKQIRHIIDVSRFNNFQKATVYFAYCNGLKPFHEQTEPITEREKDWIYYASKGAGLSQAKPGKYKNVVNYDVNSMYPHIMSIQYFKIPLKQGEFKTYEELPEFIPYGIYRANITRPHKNHKSFFLFKNKLDINFYTSIDLTIAREQGLNIELVKDGKDNALLYGNNKRVNSHNIFKKFVDKLYKVKKQYKKNKLIKFILNCLWGELSRSTFKYSNLGDNIYHEGKIDGNKIKVSNEKYEYDFARLKPFIFSYGRQIMHKILKNISYDKVYRIHTDSILCDDDIILPISDKLGALKIEYKSPLVEVVNTNLVIKH